MKIIVEGSDLIKVRNALRNAAWFFRARDEMNTLVQLAQDICYSPITLQIKAELERMETLLSNPEELGGWKEEVS